MKKMFGLLIIVCALLLMGCGNTKKLECAKVFEDYGEIDRYSLTYTKDGLLKSVTYRALIENYIEGELTTSERAELNSKCDDIQELGMKQLSCKVNIKGRDVELVISATGIDKMTKAEIETADLDDFTDYTYDELKVELVDSGFICK